MTQIDIQPSNMCPIATSQTSVPQIYVLFQILKSASNSQIYGCFSLSQIDIQYTDVCPNPKQEIGHRSENLERTLI
jgi:hypothetical protein